MRKLLICVAALALAGCGVTPMFNPPIAIDPTPEQKTALEARHLEIAGKLVGSWKSGDEAEAKVSIGKDNIAMLEMSLKDGDKGMRKVPMYGLCMDFGGRPYLVFCANLNTPEHEAVADMVRPNFYAACLSFDGGDKVTAELITWKTEGEHAVATDPALVFDRNADKTGDTVMNSSAELCDLIAARKYRVAKTYVFERVK